MAKLFSASKVETVFSRVETELSRVEAVLSRFEIILSRLLDFEILLKKRSRNKQ